MLKKFLLCAFSFFLFTGCQKDDSSKQSLKDRIEERIEEKENPENINVGPVPT